ncbi:UvrD-helicase domain-containing protein [Streptomyces sp. NPDC001858]
MARLDTLEAVIEELEARRSFLVEAGAGAGKTTTLVKALQFLLGRHRAQLEANGRHIACITYTNVAKREILERISADPLVAVGTIHEFLWSVIQRYQRELWKQVLSYNETLKKPEDLSELASPPVVTYSDRGRKLSEGRISHNEVIALSLRLVEAHPKLKPITKHDNHRCSPPVVEVLNKMRPELIQKAVGDRQQGEVHLFLNADTAIGPQRLEVARTALAERGSGFSAPLASAPTQLALLVSAVVEGGQID